MIKAINPAHQRTVNKFVKYDDLYGQQVNINDAAEDNDQPLTAAMRNKQANRYERAADAWEELPKREQANLSKHLDTAGY